ncbi:hypothetical protein JX266_007314 [Neoarthrinium moseri]|nr:hypothetical protein JX266_007314 [Neoarthrinium moseri]
MRCYWIIVGTLHCETSSTWKCERALHSTQQIPACPWLRANGGTIVASWSKVRAKAPITTRVPTRRPRVRAAAEEGPAGGGLAGGGLAGMVVPGGVLECQDQERKPQLRNAIGAGAASFRRAPIEAKAKRGEAQAAPQGPTGAGPGAGLDWTD